MKKLIFSVILVVGCSSTTRSGSSLSQLPLNSCEAINTVLKEELSRYQDAVDQAGKGYAEEQWKVEAADPSASHEKLSKLFVVLQEKSYDKAVLQQVIAIDNAAVSLKSSDCPMKEKLQRARTLLETAILTDDAVIRKEKENQDKQDAMVNKSNGFRITIPGEKEPVSKALYSKKVGATSDRSVREKLYREFNSARAKAWVEWGFRDLIKSRNEEARLAGFKNFYEYRFFRNQLDLANYRSMVKEIKTKLAPKVRRVLSNWGKDVGISKVEGWDMRYLRERAASGEINEFLKNLPENRVLEIAKKFYDALGISVDSYGFTMDLYPRPGKNTHAFAMGVVTPHVNEKKEVLPDPKPDIRFLANLKKPVQWDDISTIIHELGHAIHYGEVRQPLAIFRGIGSVETEAIAMTVERMADSGEFLSKAIPEFTGVSQSQLAPVLKKQVNASKVEQAFVLLRQVFFSDFEHEVYRNPDADFADLWNKMHQEYWGVEIQPSMTDWDIEHFLMAPVYVQNYAIGIVMVEQLYESILKDFKTSFQSAALGTKLKSVYFSPGLEWNYLSLTKQFTGRPLSAKSALKLLN